MSVVARLISWKRPRGTTAVQDRAEKVSGRGAACGAGGPQTELHMGPSLTVPRDQVGKETGVLRPEVECGHILEALATGREKAVAALDGDLLECLEAVHREARAHDRNLPRPARRHVPQD